MTPDKSGEDFGRRPVPRLDDDLREHIQLTADTIIAVNGQGKMSRHEIADCIARLFAARRPPSAEGEWVIQSCGIYTAEGVRIGSAATYEDAQKIQSAHGAAMRRAREAIEQVEREKKDLRDKLDDMLVAEVKRYGGIPRLSDEELTFRGAMAEFLSVPVIMPALSAPTAESAQQEQERSEK